jgi:uncharacterized protein (DUF169 family)
MPSDLPTLAQSLSQALNLALPPIAIGFADEVPAGVAHWPTPVAAGCRFWQEAAQATFATTATDHDLCAIGTFTHNLAVTPAHEVDRGDALGVFADLGYVRPEDIPLIPVLNQRPNVVLYGPLAAFPAQPAVVLLFVRPDQTLLLAEATQQVEGGLTPAMGRPACAIVPQAVNTGRAALSLGCCGARAYLDVLADETALYALPGDKLAAYAERLTALAQANTILGRFHQLRRLDVRAGQRPTIKESLARRVAGAWWPGCPNGRPPGIVWR